MPDERRYLQSKQKKKTCNPYFDETLVFQVSFAEFFGISTHPANCKANGRQFIPEFVMCLHFEITIILVEFYIFYGLSLSSLELVRV